MTYSLFAYRSVLEAAKRRRAAFVPFTMSMAESEVPHIYLRHDVDFSLEMATLLAAANADLGVSGTFFLLLRSPVYNLLSDAARHAIERLLGLGQRLGLHVAVPAGLPQSPTALRELVLSDFEMARGQVPELDPVFAWHNTTPELLRLGLDLEVPGLVNAYSERLFKHIPYRSDTGMRYDVDAWLAMMLEPWATAQLLFHPELWVGGGATPTDALARTWPYVIREREIEFRANRFYGAQFPAGIPEPLLEQLVSGVITAAAASPAPGAAT